MRISPREAWIVARLLGDRTTELEETERIGPLAEVLRRTLPRERPAVWRGFLAAIPDREGWSGPVDDADVMAEPPPMPEPDRATAGLGQGPGATATLDDLKRMVSVTAWPWPGWLAGGVLNTLAANPGVGKTILAMNLAKALWRGELWPDGGRNPFPAGTTTLWVPGDRHYPQLIELAERYGLPGAAMLFNAPPGEPTTGLDLDDEENLDRLERTVRSRSPGLVIVDTVGMTTERNLGRPEDARAYFSPLMEIAGATGVSFLLLTHLSKEAQALGRRIVGASRVVWKLTQPDPEGQPDRRKLWVDKSYSTIPAPLGMTITEAGATFDATPPAEPGEGRSRGSSRIDDCRQWLEDFLDGQARPIKAIVAAARAEGFCRSLLYRTREAMELTSFDRGGAAYWGPPGDPDDDRLF